MDQWDDAVFEKLPAWTQDQIKKSTQYQKNHAPDTVVEVKPPEMAAQAQAAPVQQFTQNIPVNNTGGGECPI
jgi:hypothetical protein